MSDAPIEVGTHASIRELGEAAYRSLVTPETPPFLRFEWLDALERTGCVVPERGWLPMHLSVRQEGELVAAAPAYVKGNSEGEFVFDHAWARFSEVELGLAYYPKLVVAVPFTPATGPRLLVRPGVAREPLLRGFVRALDAVCRQAELSGAHVLFPPEAEVTAYTEAGMLERHGVQFHWQNAGYETFDDFLGCFNAKRRHQIKRERRELLDRGVVLDVFTGTDLRGGALADFVFDFYVATVDKFAWGRRYLNRGFFEEVLATMPDALHVVVARDASGKKLGGAFNLLGRQRLYGRYWGATAEVPFLHFNVCFYKGVEEAIHRKLEAFEPGAGGEHKVARGFEPTVTRSAHLLVDPRLRAAVADHLRRERRAVDEHVESADPVLRPLG